MDATPSQSSTPLTVLCEPSTMHMCSFSWMEEQLNASRRKQLIQTACDIEEVLNAYEHLAVRVFIFEMAVYGVIRAALR